MVVSMFFIELPLYENNGIEKLPERENPNERGEKMFAQMISPGTDITGLQGGYCKMIGPEPIGGACINHGDIPFGGYCSGWGISPIDATCSAGFSPM